MFNIMNLASKKLLANAQGDYLIWETAKEAQFVCETYNENFGEGKKIFEIRKVASNDDWIKREQTRFENGTYTLPDFLIPISELNPNHFLHLAKDNQNLSYTRDALKGLQDSQTKISLQGYFERYHPKLLKSPEFQELKAKWQEFITQNDGLKFATTEEDIVRVYTKYDPNIGGVATSCMRGSFSNLPKHPVAAYAAGDLAVAYLEDERNRTIARSVVWPEKKYFSRVYGESAIIGKLQARGYQEGSYYGSSKSFEGARLLIIPYKKFYVMPYLDEAGLIAVKKDGFFVLKKCEYNERSNTQHANGTTQTGREFECYVCSELHDSHSAFHVHDRQGQVHSWCRGCTNQYAFVCSQTGQRFDNGERFVASYAPYRRELYMVDMYDGQIWARHTFDRLGFTCAKTKKNYPNMHKVLVHVNTKTVEAWHREYFLKEGWNCYLTGKNFSNEYPHGFVIISGQQRKIDKSVMENNRAYESTDGVTFTPKEVAQDVSTFELPSTADATFDYRSDIHRAIRDFGRIRQTSTNWSSYPYLAPLWPITTSSTGYVATSTTTTGTTYSVTQIGVQGPTVGRSETVHDSVAVSPTSAFQD